jgi:hypothetical protein
MITASILDFPRALLSSDLWVYSEPSELPRLVPSLRYLIIGTAKKELKKFGLRLKDLHLYGGSAGYQWHPGTDVDTAMIVDWEGFDGDIEAAQDHFKLIEDIEFKGYPVHFFLKSKEDTLEVSEAIYDILNDEWILPPLVLPTNFDPEEYFAPLLKEAERKAKRIDLLLGELLRALGSFKSACSALETARDKDVVLKRMGIERDTVSKILQTLSDGYQSAKDRRNKMHEQLREKLQTDQRLARLERFQEPEIVWKYLDRSGYSNFLHKVNRLVSKGKISNLLDMICGS